MRKKRIFISGLILAMSFAVLTGCGKKAEEIVDDTVIEETKTEETKAEETKTDEKVSDQEENQSMEPEETVEEETAKEQESGDVKLYEDVLEEYRNYCMNFEEIDAEPGSGFYGMTEALYYAGTDAIGYVIQDINDDNVPELFIANINDADTGFGYGSFIYAMWSIVDSKPALIMEGYTRSSYNITKDNKLLYMGSGGAMNSGYGLFTYEPGAVSLTCEEFLFTDEYPKESGEIGYFTNNTGDWDVSKSKESTLSADKFWDDYDKYCEEIISLKLDYLINKQMYGVGVNYAGVIWDSYDQYESYNIDNGEYSNIVAVYASEDIKGIRVSKLSLEDVDNNGNGIFSSEGLYYSENFDMNNPLILRMSFPGDTSAYGLSFTDKDGNDRNIGITVSGRDGSLVLSDVVIK